MPSRISLHNFGFIFQDKNLYSFQFVEIFAEENCDQLKDPEGVFAVCHDYVPVSPFVEARLCTYPLTH